MRGKRFFALLTMSLVFLVALVGCSDKKSSGEKGTSEEGLSGEITVITQRTDIVDTVFQDYAKKFNEKHPNVKVHSFTCRRLI